MSGGRTWRGLCRTSVLPGGQLARERYSSAAVKILSAKELSSLARPGTPRATHRAMIHRFSVLSTPFWRLFAPAVVGLILTAGVAEAQRPVPGKSRTTQPSQPRRQTVVPPGFLPPTGMCRIWIDDVPAGKQPAPTDCASAVRNRPANGKVLFGDDRSKAKKGKTNKSKSSPTDGLVDLITRGISR